MKSPTFFRLTFFLLWLGLFSVSHVYSQTAHCFSPGILVLNDAAGDTTPGAYDIQSIHAAEPAYGDGSHKIVFTLKVQDLLALPAASWNVIFTGPDSVTRYVQMNNLAGNTQFKYGRLTIILGIPVFTEDGTIAGAYDTNGPITLSIDKSLIGNPQPGQALQITGAVYILQLANLVSVDTTAQAQYDVRGNAACMPYQFIKWGMNGDVPVPNDYNRNGTTDFAVWRKSEGNWYAIDGVTFEINARNWGSGALGDIPVAGNFDNDGKGDYTVFRRSTGDWHIFETETNAGSQIHFGVAEDIPVAADFDGDHVDDIAVFRPSGGDWFILNSHDFAVTFLHFGASEDRPLAGDFDGDRKSDVAVFRPSSGDWFYMRSSDGGWTGLHFGLGIDVPVPADYDGDGKTDIAVWRPDDGFWYYLKSSNGAFGATKWGISTDKTAPGDYNGNGRADFAVWRPDEGIWYVYFN